MRRLVPTAILLAGIIWLGLTLVSRSAEEDRGFLADLISRALSTPSTRVSIGAVEGALSSDATIRNITIADRDGVWLRLDSARLVWRRLALLSRRLEVDRLDIGKLEILRRPLPAEEEVPGADQPLLPELPVSVQVRDFALRELALGQPILGVPAQLSATGAASLGSPSEGLNLRFDARRLDAPGQLTARLLYASENLQLTLALDEPAGGILARASNIPGLPPVKLDLSGTGTLDAFGAQLTFDAGDTIGAKGQANLRRAGSARLLDIDTQARIEGLLPSIAAPVFAGTTTLNAQISFADDSSVEIPQLSVASHTARLDVAGRVATGGMLDLKVTARALPTVEGKTVAGLAEIRKLAFDGSISGPLASPLVGGKLDAEDVRLPSGRFGKIAATFSTSPNGPLSEKTTRIAFSADASASGVVLTDPALANAVGTQLTLTLRGTGTPDGTANVEAAHLTTRTFDATYAGQLGSREAQGKLSLTAQDLSRFADIASLRLRGALALTADVTGLLSPGPVIASLNGNATRFATGIAPVDGLIGGQLTLTGTVQTLRGNGFGFRDLLLKGAYADLRLNGDGTFERVDLNAALQLPDLSRADGRLTGRATAAATLTGSLSRLMAEAHAQVDDATALGRPVPRLALEASVGDLTGHPAMHATLSGEIDRKPVSGTLHVSQNPEGAWSVDPLDVKVGSATIVGQVSVSADRLAAGQIKVDARNLDDLSPLVLTRLSGDMAGTLILSSESGRQNASLRANGSRLRAAEINIDRFTADLSATDLYARPIIDGSLAVDRARIAGQDISQIRLDAKGSPAASDINLSAKASGFDLTARGRVVPAMPTRLEIATLVARRDRRQISLAQPATLIFDGGTVDIQRFSLAVDRGTISVEGRVGTEIDLTLDARAVPLSAVDILVPGTGLAGALNGSARMSGTASRPAGSWRLRVSDLVAPQTRNLGLPAVDLSAEGELRNGRTSINATANAGRAGTLRVSGDAPLDASGSLNLAVQGRIDLGIANGYLSISGQSVTGVANVDARIAGTAQAPSVNGSANLTGGSFTDAVQGVRLSDIHGRVVARDTDITIEQLVASTRNNGRLSATGRVRIDPSAGFPGEIRITGQHAELVSNDIVTTTADLALSLSGALARNPHIDGEVRIASMEVRIPERLPATIRPLTGTKHVDPTPTAAARLALAAKAKARSRRAPPFDAALNLTVSAPNRIYVRGRGIQAELGGNLQLTGNLANPVAIGAFELRNGRLTVVGTRLDFTRGNLTFTGDLTPALDFAAETRAGDVTAQVFVTGTAREPRFTFSSDPDLPQDEVLSRILFSKASGGLSVGQALQLAQVAAQFAGGGGDDVFESLRKSLGVQGLDISFGADGSPAVGISKALSDRVSVGVKAGASAEQSGVSVDIDVTRRIRIQGEVGANGSTSVGVGAEWEY
ncbi:translocation/assembly module TamB domain-containing protein [Microvirga sp. 17 mud 1-3]|uniref:translocation/assembly module TamB domain-containing protein n=1 Tax=Microvirga sp. 17 mud 1-3 TaxID=2082949 RepID=UPI0013A583AF|nr:translocation/assembly module TamB domain-containing protein [Microvirga sp. 17 mud 1-3]